MKLTEGVPKILKEEGSTILEGIILTKLGVPLEAKLLDAKLGELLVGKPGELLAERLGVPLAGLIVPLKVRSSRKSPMSESIGEPQLLSVRLVETSWEDEARYLLFMVDGVDEGCVASSGLAGMISIFALGHTDVDECIYVLADCVTAKLAMKQMRATCV